MVHVMWDVKKIFILRVFVPTLNISISPFESFITWEYSVAYNNTMINRHSRRHKIILLRPFRNLMQFTLIAEVNIKGRIGWAFMRKYVSYLYLWELRCHSSHLMKRERIENNGCYSRRYAVLCLFCCEFFMLWLIW